MPTLTLNYREVARLNQVHWVKLGAFNDKIDCQYHYGEDIHCAIGLADTELLIPLAANKLIAFDLTSYGVEVDSDDVGKLIFIQEFHDFAVGQNSTEPGPEEQPFWGSPPPEVEHLVSPIQNPREVTPELYREVMARLAELGS